MDLAEAQQRTDAPAARHPWETARVEVVRKLIARHVALEPGAVVLDIGCGDGFVVGELARAFPDAIFYGVDTALTTDLILRYQHDAGSPNVRLLSSLDMFTPPGGRVALVLLMDVLEHIEHDQAFLTTLGRSPYMSSDTRILITVPAYQSLFCSPDVFLGHYRRYSNALLRRCVERSGLAVVDVGYFFASLLPVRALQVLRERALTSRPVTPTTGLVSWRGGRVAASLFTRLLVMDAALGAAARRVGLRIPGLSNYAICRKAA